VDLIREAHGKAESVQAEVTDANRVQALVGRIVVEHGRLDCAFNNDGIEGDLMEMHEVSDRNSN
jgi:NAD(P)-dependent dehydrogenase (short-subunit alcohol dehydrogenase family)